MAGRHDFDFQVTGLKELIEGLRTMQDRTVLRSVVGGSFAATARTVVIPEMRRQMGADFKTKNNPKRVQAARGRGGPASRSVTARRGRLRAGELVAENVGPRAWWSHFPIGGTKAHLLTGRAGRSPYLVIPGVSDAGAARAARRAMGTGGIRLAGARGPAQVRGVVRFNRGVRHPGTTGTDSVAKAARRVAPVVNERYARDLQAAYERHITRRMKAARPRE